MIFIEQAIRMLLREEGPMDRSPLISRVAEQMHLIDLSTLIESTLDSMITKGELRYDENGKIRFR